MQPAKMTMTAAPNLMLGRANLPPVPVALPAQVTRPMFAPTSRHPSTPEPPTAGHDRRAADGGPAMRLAVVAPGFPRVSETFVLSHVTGLIDRGHDVTIYGLGPGDDGDGAGVRHPAVADYGLLDRLLESPEPPRSRLGRLVGGPLLAARLLGRGPAGRRALAAFSPARLGYDALTMRPVHDAVAFARGPRRFDAIVCHFATVARRVEAVRRAGVVAGPIVTHYHGVDVTAGVMKRPRDYRRLLRDGELHLPVSERFARILVDHGTGADRTRVHLTGVDLSLFPFVPRDRAARSPLRVVSVARLVEKKGIDDALAAVRRAVDAGADVDYTVVGAGPLRDDLERRAAGLDLCGRVRFTGAVVQAEVRRILGESHLLLAPSVVAANGDEEGQPVAIKEAMAAGLPVISTRHAGIPEMIDHGRSGLLADERDPAALAQHLRRLWDDPALGERLAAAARETAERLYDQEAIADELVALLRGAAEGTAPRRGRAAA